ncbi:PPE-repeat protein [Actinosynnema pretiosum]|nr:PPE-repeat protein [Actinosynnema pretiosum]
MGQGQETPGQGNGQHPISAQQRESATDIEQRHYEGIPESPSIPLFPGSMVVVAQRAVAGAQANVEIAANNVALTSQYQQTGQGYRPSMDANCQNYLSRDHPTLKGMVNDNMSPASARQQGDAWNEVGNTLVTLQDGLRSATEASKDAWTGTAAESARTYFGGVTDWSAVAATSAQLTSGRLHQQSEAAERAKLNMPEPVQFSRSDAIALFFQETSFSNLDGGIKAVAEKYEAKQAAHEEAAQVMSTMATSFQQTGSTMPSFAAPPPMTGSDTGSSTSGDSTSISSRPDTSVGNGIGSSSGTGRIGGTGTGNGGSYVYEGGPTGGGGTGTGGGGNGNGGSNNSGGGNTNQSGVTNPGGIGGGGGTGGGGGIGGGGTGGGGGGTGGGYVPPGGIGYVPPGVGGGGGTGNGTGGLGGRGGLGGTGAGGLGGRGAGGGLSGGPGGLAAAGGRAGGFGGGAGGFGAGGSGMGGGLGSGGSSSALGEGGRSGVGGYGSNAAGGLGGAAAGRGGAAAGGMGAGGMGAAGGRGNGEEDKEHKSASYLQETEDVFGDGTLVAPPVIGG